MTGKAVEAAVLEVRGKNVADRTDRLAVEAPLEIRVREGGVERPLSITMRTPGEDEELAAGFLFAEGLLRTRGDITAIAASDGAVVVDLALGIVVPAERTARPFAMTSACGVCGKASLEGLRLAPAAPLPAGPRLDPAVIHRLPDTLRAAQAAFASTGGLHAAGLFDADGRLLLAREDVGRHNAVDKVTGRLFLDGCLPAPPSVLLVSGRASFELVQKALAAGIPALAAVGAPSSLAADLATEAGMTLLGFVRDGRFNTYAGRERIAS